MSLGGSAGDPLGEQETVGDGWLVFYEISLPKEESNKRWSWVLVAVGVSPRKDRKEALKYLLELRLDGSEVDMVKDDPAINMIKEAVKQVLANEKLFKRLLYQGEVRIRVPPWMNKVRIRFQKAKEGSEPYKNFGGVL